MDTDTRPRKPASLLDTEAGGPGKAAREWVHGMAGLSRGERAVALAFAWYADAAGYCWPSRYSVAFRSAYTVRSVQSLTESLIARGVLIEAGTKVTRDKHGGVLKRTRLYRLALGKLAPVMPATERRRLARELAGESDKIALPIGGLSKVQNLHSRGAENEPVESAMAALSRPVESAKIAHNPKNNPGDTVAAAEGQPLEPAAAAPADRATNVNIVAAREAVESPAELTPAELAATVDRRRQALSRGKVTITVAPGAGKAPVWWLAQPRNLTTAGDRPNRRAGDRKDWRRGAKA